MHDWLHKIISLKYRFSFIRRIQAKFCITYSDMFGITYSDIQERTHSFLEKSWIQWSLRQLPLQQFIYFLKIWSFERRRYLLNRFFLTAYLLQSAASLFKQTNQPTSTCAEKQRESMKWLGGLGSCCSVTKPCPPLWDPLDCSPPGYPVTHCLLEFAQVHVHWVGDALQPAHPLPTPSPPLLVPTCI